MMRPHLAGQFAGAQTVLHGQRLGHVGHRLVDLLQVTLVLHLRVVLADTLVVTRPFAQIINKVLRLE